LRVRTTMTTASPVLALAGALLAAACGGGGGSAEAAETTEQDTAAGVEAFCDGAQDLYDQFTVAGADDPTSPAMREVYDGARGLTPPEEIAADWRTILDSIEPLMTGEVDVNDPTAMLELTEQATANAAVYERVGTYVGENCDIQPATTTTVATAEAGETGEAVDPTTGSAP
jgi:hypothetical protein